MIAFNIISYNEINLSLKDQFLLFLDRKILVRDKFKELFFYLLDLYKRNTRNFPNLIISLENHLQLITLLLCCSK